MQHSPLPCPAPWHVSLNFQDPSPGAMCRRRRRRCCSCCLHVSMGKLIFIASGYAFDRHALPSTWYFVVSTALPRHPAAPQLTTLFRFAVCVKTFGSVYRHREMLAFTLSGTKETQLPEAAAAASLSLPYRRYPKIQQTICFIF